MESVIENTIEAGALRFEACAQFHPSADDLLICACGWLEEDHGELAAVRVRRRHRRSEVIAPERKAS
ncbi:MAG: hypothetical protein WD271_04720 [Acidimicrobiia bacterium]